MQNLYCTNQVIQSYFSWSSELARSLGAAFVVEQIHEVEKTWESKDHVPGVQALSTVQYSWLRPCLSTFGMFRGVNKWLKLKREEENASERSCTSILLLPHIEDLFNSLVGWWFKLIGLKIYETHWSWSSNICVRPSSWGLDWMVKLICVYCIELLLSASFTNHHLSYEIRYTSSWKFNS